MYVAVYGNRERAGLRVVAVPYEGEERKTK